MKTALALALAAAALALAGGAAAAAPEPPSATALAQRGTLKLVVRALLDPRAGELKATWLDAPARCAASRTRTLRVSYAVDLVLADGRTLRRVAPARRLVAAGCPEGGPNAGFDVTARGLRLACAGGTWRPGRYAITVRAVDVASGLVASVNLYHRVATC